MNVGKSNTALGIVLESGDSVDGDDVSHNDNTTMDITYNEDKENPQNNEKDRFSVEPYFKLVKDQSFQLLNWGQLNDFKDHTNERSLFKEKSNNIQLTRSFSKDNMQSVRESLTRSSLCATKSRASIQKLEPTNNDTLESIQRLKSQNKPRHQQRASITSISQLSTNSRSLTKRSLGRMSLNPQTETIQNKQSIIQYGLQKNQENMAQKNEILKNKINEKKELSLRIIDLKKRILQNKKQLQVTVNDNRIISEEISKLEQVQVKKTGKNQFNSKELMTLRKDVMLLEKECDDLRCWKEGMQHELKAEKELLDAIHDMITGIKKNINEVKKDKEKLIIGIKSNYKIIESLQSRKERLNQDNLKLLALNNQRTELQPQQNTQSSFAKLRSQAAQSHHSSASKKVHHLNINTQSSHNFHMKFASPLLRGMAGGTVAAGTLSIPSTADDHRSKVEVENGEGWQEYVKVKQDLDDTIKDLDQKLNRVLAKQEYDYLKGYNIYVKKKEKELRDLIKKIVEKNQAATYKDDQVNNLESTIQNLRNDQIKMEKQNQEHREKIKYWKTKLDECEHEKSFLYNQVMQAKKKNKLLKVAITKLQSELEIQTANKEEQQKHESEKIKSQFFITDILQAVEVPKKNNALQPSPRLHNTSAHVLDSSQIHDVSTMQFSLMEPSTQNVSQINTSRKRYKSTSVSRYANIPTQNIKFEKFIELLFASKMNNDEIKTEIKPFVQALETNYNEMIRDLKDKNDRLLRKLKTSKCENTNKISERSDFETLFVQCIEDVRREVMKRRLRAEISKRKKTNISNLNMDQDEAKEFEESLEKLASYGKNRISFQEFNSQDRFNLIDIFVNNEKTLIKIYDALFPQRSLGGIKTPNQLDGQSQFANTGFKIGPNTTTATARGNKLSFDFLERLAVNDSLIQDSNVLQESKDADTQKTQQMFPQIQQIQKEILYSKTNAANSVRSSLVRQQ